MEIKYEVWKDRKRYVVAREEGRIIQRRAIKSSGIKKREFRNIFKENNTFYDNRIRTKLGKQLKDNKTENQYLKPVGRNLVFDNKTPIGKPLKKPRGLAQYQVSGMFQGTMYYGRSYRKGTFIGKSQTSKECREEAWKNFFKFIAQADNGHYDADEGISVVENNQVSNIQEGWVFYN